MEILKRIWSVVWLILKGVWYAVEILAFVIAWGACRILFHLLDWAERFRLKAWGRVGFETMVPRMKTSFSGMISMFQAIPATANGEEVPAAPEKVEAKITPTQTTPPTNESSADEASSDGPSSDLLPFATEGRAEDQADGRTDEQIEKGAEEERESEKRGISLEE